MTRVFVLCAAASVFAAGCSPSKAATGSSGGGSPEAMCTPCLHDADCGNPGHEYCILETANSGYCASVCSATTNCGDGNVCFGVASTISVCYPATHTCVGNPTTAGTTAGSSAGTTAGSTASASTGTTGGNSTGNATTATSSTATTTSAASTNGSTATTTASSATTTTSSATTTSSGATSTSSSSGSLPTGTITDNGGTVSSLYFAVVGDTRPPNVDEDSSYPTAIVQNIYQNIQSLGALFVIATGDYQYATPTNTHGATQLADYATARSAFSGKVFPAMGNHECDGYTADNCGSDGSLQSGSHSGTVSKNYAAYKSTLLDPINQSLPYYVLNFNITDTVPASTAKFVFIACNAWDSTQSSWLASALAVPSTYTFIVRHENDNADETTKGPCQPDSENIISQYHFTVELTGHTHNFNFYSNYVVVGNGGAPLTSVNEQYGYALVKMVPGGNVEIDEIDYNSTAPINAATFPP